MSKAELLWLEAEIRYEGRRYYVDSHWGSRLFWWDGDEIRLSKALLRCLREKMGDEVERDD